MMHFCTKTKTLPSNRQLLHSLIRGRLFIFIIYILVYLSSLAHRLHQSVCHCHSFERRKYFGSELVSNTFLLVSERIVTFNLGVPGLEFFDHARVFSCLLSVQCLRIAFVYHSVYVRCALPFNEVSKEIAFYAFFG